MPAAMRLLDAGGAAAARVGGVAVGVSAVLAVTKPGSAAGVGMGKTAVALLDFRRLPAGHPRLSAAGCNWCSGTR